MSVEQESIQQNIRRFSYAPCRRISMGQLLCLQVELCAPAFLLIGCFMLQIVLFASDFSKSLPMLFHVDDIVFRKPVEIGSLLYFASQVYIYRDGSGGIVVGTLILTDWPGELVSRVAGGLHQR